MATGGPRAERISYPRQWARKTFRENSDIEFHFEQTAQDLNPFVVAGRYRETHQDLPGNQKLRIWSRTDVSSAQLQQAAESLSKTLAVYDSLFATRNNARPPLWIVECPEYAGCFSHRATAYSSLLYGRSSDDSSEMISRDTVLLDPRTAFSSLRPLPARHSLLAGSATG